MNQILKWGSALMAGLHASLVWHRIPLNEASDWALLTATSFVIGVGWAKIDIILRGMIEDRA